MAALNHLCLKSGANVKEIGLLKNDNLLIDYEIYHSVEIKKKQALYIEKKKILTKQMKNERVETGINVLIYHEYFNWDIGPAVRVFANGPKTLKMELDTTLLNTQHYKVRFKGKVEQSREWSSALPYTLVVAIEKGAFGSPSTMVANFTLLTLNMSPCLWVTYP